MVSTLEEVDFKFCRIVEAHYFRGRIESNDSNNPNDRSFDDILSREGVITHYLPAWYDFERGQYREKGIDVSFALEAYELTLTKHFDVCVLIVCDSDYIPLVRKLNSLGTKVMVLAWRFVYFDQNKRYREQRISDRLLDEASYSILMHNEIEDASNDSESFIHGIFVAHTDFGDDQESSPDKDNPVVVRQSGIINTVKKEGHGFIACPSNSRDAYFRTSDVLDYDFNFLMIGDIVEYDFIKKSKKVYAKNIRVITRKDEQPSSENLLT